MAVLALHDEVALCGYGYDIDPFGIVQDIVFGDYAAVGQLQALAACCEPWAAIDVF